VADKGWVTATGPRGGLFGPDTGEADARTVGRFSDYWTNESLYDAGPADSQPPPTDTGLDLDAAHLVLQVPLGAEWDQITAAHRRLAKLYHPDRLMAWSPGAQALGRSRMAEINAAHAALRKLHFR
jgi:DnaJ-domain-containing protein 1